MKNLVSRLEALARHEDALFPGVKTGDLASELAFLDRLGFVSATIRVNTENLVHALEQALPFLERGSSNARIDEAVSHAADLCARTLATVRSLIERHAEDIATSIGAAGHEGYPGPAAQEDRPAARSALPRPALVDDSPILLQRLKIFTQDCDGSFGRVSGEAVIMQLGRVETAAPIDSVVLEDGALLRFAPGESFVLESAGLVLGDRTRAPRKTGSITILCEAGKGGVTLYGPAVVRFVDFPAGTLSRSAEVLNRFLEESRNDRWPFMNSIPVEMMEGRLHADLVSMWPGCSFSRIHPRMLDHKETRGEFLEENYDFAMSTRTCNGMNFLPESVILTRKGEDVRFIDVPKALPAPRRGQAMTA